MSRFDTVEFADNPDPRAPCVLVLDVSGSMDGARIRELNAGIQAFRDSIRADSIASRRVEPAIVTFDDRANLVCDFGTSDTFAPPVLEAGGTTALASGLALALDQLQLRKQTYKDNGIAYYRPWVFLITDGAPTDPAEQIESVRARLQREIANKSVTFFAVGVEGADMAFLGSLDPSRAAVSLRGLEFRELFRWLSASMQRVSQSRAGDKVDLPAPTGWAQIDV